MLVVKMELVSEKAQLSQSDGEFKMDSFILEKPTHES